MNSPLFQDDFFELEKNEQTALIKILKKIRKLTWSELYVDKSIRWEMILSKKTKSGERVYSLRFSQKYRALAIREENFLRLLTLHVNHDGAYK